VEAVTEYTCDAEGCRLDRANPGRVLIDSWLKYLELLQAAIARMAANSFAIKAWSVGLGTVIIGLTAKDGSPHLACLALLPGFAFWYLDAYYLSLESLFRELYEAATAPATAAAQAGGTGGGIAPTFGMRPGNIKRKLYAENFWKPPVYLIHLSIVLVALLTTALGLLRLVSAGLTHVHHPPTFAVTNTDIAISIVRRHFCPPTVITGIDTIDLVHGTDKDPHESVWHIRVGVRRPGRGKTKAYNYKADAFVRAVDGWAQYIGH
jgi:hypothetical protein